MADRIAIGLPVIPGALTDHVGAGALPITTLNADMIGDQIDVRLSDASTTDTVVTLQVTGVADLPITIPAGERHVQAQIGSDYADGAAIALAITSAPAYEAFGLSGDLLLTFAASATPSPPGPWLVSYEAAIAALGLSPPAGSDLELFVKRQLEVLTQIARSYCERWFNPAVYVETIRDPTSVHLYEPPVSAVASVVADGTALAASAYEWNHVGRLLRKGATRADWTGVSELEVTYTAGYSPIPYDVQEWALMGLRQKYNGWASSLGLEPVTSIRKEVFPDAGSIEYTDWRTGGPAPHFIAGIPLEALDLYAVRRLAADWEYTRWARSDP